MLWICSELVIDHYLIAYCSLKDLTARDGIVPSIPFIAYPLSPSQDFSGVREKAFFVFATLHSVTKRIFI